MFARFFLEVEKPTAENENGKKVKILKPLGIKARLNHIWLSHHEEEASTA